MSEFKVIEELIKVISELPSVGNKTAERIAYALLDFDQDKVKEIGQSIATLPLKIKRCSKCGGYSLNEICHICLDDKRDQTFLIVVNEPKDIFTFEKSKGFNGLYFVLGELLRGKPKETIRIRIDLLKKRIEKEGIEEVLIATPMIIEGQATALYLAKELQKENIKITRLAYGLPFGANLEYVDSLTIKQAIIARTKLGGE